ncbi:MAG: hypothetical protein L3K52_14880 [Candidatus Thiothrix sulfatifontis]|nr:MAG: hypothetical protein L3K52_14880 [Candidatus Thiothrix sulfatifontis]
MRIRIRRKVCRNSPWRDWPDARLLTRQEQRDWDFREQNLQAQGVRLLQADATGIQQAWGEAARRPAALEAARWEVEGQKPDESDAAYLERALGAALPWAQALAYYPGAWSLAAAERLREALFADVPRLALQRLLGFRERGWQRVWRCLSHGCRRRCGRGFCGVHGRNRRRWLGVGWG